MITGELKNKIDGIWDIFWSSGMTNPLTVIEQITYLMFIKILDDNELRKEANAAAFDMPVVDPIFDAEHQNCRWSNFRHYDADSMFSNMTDKVFPFIKNDLTTGKDTAFARYMKDALFLVPTARVLVKVVDALDSLDLNNKDIMGDVYEYLLSQIAQSGTNGQFRTPRHIIKMMVELMQPTLEDTICDPAMGSAGFICAAAQFITEHYSKDLMQKARKQHYTTTMFTGFDTDQTMLRIGAMNMMLHGVEAPNITWMDSLSEDNTHREEYTLIMANPPFIMHYGAVCRICGFDFSTVYGPEFAGIIEVHHIVPLSEIREGYVVDPIHDLIPVCSNCHTALHSKKDGVYKPEEVQAALKKTS